MGGAGRARARVRPATGRRAAAARVSARPGNLTPLLRLVGAHRARDPDRRAPRRMGRGLRDRPQARALHRLHDRDRRGRERVRAARRGARDDADDARASSWRTSTRSSAATCRRPRTRCSAREDLDAPGPLHDAHEGALEALRFRVNGLRGLQTAFQETADADGCRCRRQQLAAQGQRLLASDIVWADSFRAPCADGSRVARTSRASRSPRRSSSPTTRSCRPPTWRRSGSASRAPRPAGRRRASTGAESPM